jgi:hypothetical protein
MLSPEDCLTFQPPLAISLPFVAGKPLDGDWLASIHF